MRFLACLAVWLFCAVAAAQDNRSNELKPVMRPDRAVPVALNDLRAISSIDPTIAPLVRYVMVNLPEEYSSNGTAVEGATRGALSYASSIALLHSATPRRATPVGQGYLYRINLGELADYDVNKLALLIDTWDRQVDSQFYQQTDEWKEIRTPRYFRGGKVWERARVRVVIPRPHADVGGYLTALIQETGSAVPIISEGQFYRFLLNSEFGGLYPEFRQFDLSPAVGTAEEAFLLRAGVRLDALSEKNSDQRVALFRNPTANVGFIEYVSASVTQPGVGPTIATITRDYFAGEVAQDKHPFENLLDRKHDGTEIFLPTPSGGLEFALYDAAGGFVRSAPVNPPNTLATDRTLPNFQPVLQAPSGCIRCHVTTNPSTRLYAIYQPAPNYIAWMRDTNINGQRWDVFQDRGNADKALQRLVSLFRGETDDAFAYAGRTYAKHVFEVSGLPFETAANTMMRRHDAWLYEFVTPSKALLTLGYYEPDNERAVQIFNTICPPTLEPIRLGMIRGWRNDRQMKVTIDDWLAVYPEVMLRVQAWEAQQRQPAAAK